MIQFKNISCRLGDRVILKNISGEIEPGKITAILGPNGCGKSTLLRAILGLVPFEGRIFWNEKRIRGVTEISSHLGYLPQMKEIYWPLTCEAIVRLGDGRQAAGDTAKIMGRLSISHLNDKRIDQVSGGERTLVLLARSLMNRPEILIADEPVSELDPAYQIKVMQILREEAARGAVVLVTMHDIQLTQRFCDTVFLMRDGVVFDCGKASQALNRNNLKIAFGISFTEARVLYAE